MRNRFFCTASILIYNLVSGIDWFDFAWVYNLENSTEMCCNYGHPNRMTPICFIWNPLFTGVSAMLYKNATGEKP